MIKNFPNTVKEEYSKLNDGICCKEVFDHTGYHLHRCHRKVKETIDGVGFCGFHARSVKKWRYIKNKGRK